jgi:hypothetical protein
LFGILLHKKINQIFLIKKSINLTQKICTLSRKAIEKQFEILMRKKNNYILSKKEWTPQNRF